MADTDGYPESAARNLCFCSATDCGRDENVAVEFGSGMKRLAEIGAFFILIAGLAGCERKAPETVAVPPAAITVGSLVCADADPDAAAIVRADSGADTDTGAVPVLAVGRVSIPCPMLVVEVDSIQGRARAIGSGDREHFPLLSALTRVGTARLPGTLIGATAAAIERMAPGNNPGTLSAQTAFGLLIRGAAGAVDTVFPADLPALESRGGGAAGIEACLDSLEASPLLGTLYGPFAPEAACVPGEVRTWRNAGDSGNLPSVWNPGKSGFRLKVLAGPEDRKRADGSRAGRNWIFLATEDRHWIWRMRPGKARIAHVPFMENSGITDLSAADVDGDSVPELILEALTEYGDGFFETLYVVPGAEKSDTARIGSVALQGSSGEADGSTVDAKWWIRVPWLFHAYIQEANLGGRGESHDLRVDAYRFSDQGGFLHEKDTSFAAVVFGKPTSADSARDGCDRIAAAHPDAAMAGLRPLPRLMPEGIRWQPGAIASDSGTAEAWTRWDKSGSVLSLQR